MGKKGMNDDGEEEEETFAQFIVRTVDDVFIDNIPMDAIKELPTFYMYVMGAFAELATMVLFIYFVLQGYEQGVTTKFISLDPTSGACVDVVKSVSGAYMVDTSGIWVGNSGFDYSRAIYEMDWTDSAMTSDEYTIIMTMAKQQLMDLGTASSTMDLSTTLLMYTAWQLICDPAQNEVCSVFSGQSFVFTADSSYMFALSHIDMTLSNVHADCNSYSNSNYDLANSINTGNYQFDDFMSNSNCNTTADPLIFGYYPPLDGNDFHIDMDVRTLMDAMAVNIDVLQLNGIDQVHGFEYDSFTFNNFSYSGTYFIDAWYPGMHPMYCILNDIVGDAVDVNTVEVDYTQAVLQMCFLQLGNVTGMPLFMHYGGGDVANNQPIPCDCTKPVGSSPNCNKFAFINGMAFFNTAGMSLADTVYAFLEVVTAYGGAEVWNKAAYNASWASAASTYYPDVDPVINDTEWRRKAYQFCNSSKYGTCSVMTFNSYGDYIFDQSLTEFMFLVQDGSCASAGGEQFMIDTADFDSIIYNPPVQIVEDYYECTMLPYDAMFNAIGVAGGNIGIAVPVIMFCCLPLLYAWLKLTGNVQAQPEYEKLEKEAALDLLALQLLRIRDGRVRGMKKGGELLKVGRDLVLSAQKADGGLPDSDDSESDDDEEDPKDVSRSKTGRRRSSTKQEKRESDIVTIRRSSSVNRFIGGLVDSDDEEGAEDRMPAPQFDGGSGGGGDGGSLAHSSRPSRRVSRRPEPPQATSNPMQNAADVSNDSRPTSMYEL